MLPADVENIWTKGHINIICIASDLLFVWH